MVLGELRLNLKISEIERISFYKSFKYMVLNHNSMVLYG